jgi:cytochrome P450
MAYLEMTTILSYMLSRFELKLAEDAQSGIQWADRIVSHATKHLNVKVLNDRWE